MSITNMHTVASLSLHKIFSRLTSTIEVAQESIGGKWRLLSGLRSTAPLATVDGGASTTTEKIVVSL